MGERQVKVNDGEGIFCNFEMLKGLTTVATDWHAVSIPQCGRIYHKAHNSIQFG